MKYLLYYNLDSKFKSDQASVSGDGTSVVSVVDGVAWTEDERKAYYRYLKPNSENVTSYTITIHYKDVNGNEIAPDDFVTVEGYVGMKALKTIKAKKISGYTVIRDDTETFIINDNVEYTFKYNDTPLEETPLTFYILSSGTITWKAFKTSYKKAIQYSKNGGGWTTITSNTGSSAPKISVVAGDIVKFRGDNSSYCSYSKDNNSFSSSTSNLRFNAYGNIMSLINSTDFKSLKAFTSTSAFTGLFSGCTSLVKSDELLLPAITLTDNCYNSMFRGCTSLTQAPELPATTLAEECYSDMFNGCTSLIQAPELPATTLAEWCYSSMFYRCTNLTIAPSVLPAETLTGYCYNAMFLGCTSLKTAPLLSATKLARDCYYSMFYGCTNLNYIKAMFTTTPGSYYTGQWLSGVASSGTFVKNPDATWSSSISIGPDTVPEGWTITNATN